MTFLFWLSPVRRRLAAGLSALGLLALTLGGCGGGGGGGATGTGGGSGEVVVGLTDAPGDFLAYSVDVLSLTLTRADGTTVEALPVKTRIDFAQYTELTEFLTAATVPAGRYTGARLRLDYAQAEIVVEDALGNAAPAQARDAQGNPLATLDLTVQLDPQRPLIIAPGIPAHLTLDFNLAASNSVDLLVSPPVVTVEPFLVAEVEPEQPKMHRVRGPLVSVNAANSSYTVAIRPAAVASGDFGRLTVQTDAATVFEIDQQSYQGAAGLAVLAAKPTGTATVAVGDLDMASRRFIAHEVYGGSSVAYGTADVVTGTVIARSGDLLTLRGASLTRVDGTFAFHENITLTIADTTRVTRQLAPGQVFGKNDVSVGQRLTAFGSLSGAPGSLSLDATNGLVRMLLASLTGTVNSTGAGLVELALQTVNGRPVALYNFAGTGTAGANDADPAHYEIATGSLDLAGLNPGTPLRVRGFVQPFGQAPADFTAQTLINTINAPAALLVAWEPATATPFASLTASSLTLDLTGSPLLHHVRRGGVLTDLTGGTPSVQPTDPAHGLFAIGYQGTVTVYTQFDAYQQALGARLAASQKARAFGGLGSYTDATTSFTGRRLFTAFQ
jgi:hypothetical protein